MNQDTAIKLLSQIEQIEEQLKYLRIEIQNSTLNGKAIEPVKQKQKNRIQIAESLPAHSLGPIPNINDSNWPEAVKASAIVKSEMTKQFRAIQIMGLIDFDYENMTILDCGCGEGHLVKELASRAKKVVGYDIKACQNWINSKNVEFVNDKEELKQQFDSIILFDVLDHLEQDSPINFMTWLNSLLLPNGVIFVRTHPWTSRHGAHTYETDVNKAYIHLALTLDELAQNNIEIKPALRIVKPMAAYEHIFKTAQLQIKNRKTQTEPVDSYFNHDLLDRIIKINWKGTVNPDEAIRIMSNQFIDYVLQKN